MHDVVMTSVGWTFMIAAWTVIGGLTFWCFYKLVTTEAASGPDDEAPDEGGDAGT